MNHRRITLFEKNKTRQNAFVLLILILLSVYPVYRNYYYGWAVIQYDRHLDFLNGESEYFNPWQYRIFSPLTVEGIKTVYDVTIDKLFPIEEKFRFNAPDGFSPKDRMQQLVSRLNEPDFIKYNLIYSGYRAFLNILIFVLGFKFLSHFTNNRWLIILGVITMAFSLGNAVNDSDLTLHTYIDNILYLAAALIIIKKSNPWMIVLLSVIGATNRETSLLIPFLFLISSVDWKKWSENKFSLKKLPWPSTNVIVIVGISFVLFAAISLAIRSYYGFAPPTQWKVPAGLPMLKLNLMSASAVKTIFELVGAFSVLPLICIYKFKKTSKVLQIWFWGLVPIWFLIHFTLVIAYQSRMFLVPTFIIFLPMVIEIIEKEFVTDNRAQSAN